MKKAFILTPLLFLGLSCNKDCDCGEVKSKTAPDADGWGHAVVDWDCKDDGETQELFTPAEMQLYNVGDKYCN